MEHPVFMQATAALDRLSADDVVRLLAGQREMAPLTFEAGIAAAREEAEQKGIQGGLRKGLQKGLQKGRPKGTAALLLRLLTIKFGPQPASTAERLAGASQAELLSWSERALSAETLQVGFA